MSMVGEQSGDRLANNASLKRRQIGHDWWMCISGLHTGPNESHK